jgi:hypothetical protein
MSARSFLHWLFACSSLTHAQGVCVLNEVSDNHNNPYHNPLINAELLLLVCPFLAYFPYFEQVFWEEPIAYFP